MDFPKGFRLLGKTELPPMISSRLAGKIAYIVNNEKKFQIHIMVDDPKPPNEQEAKNIAKWLKTILPNATYNPNDSKITQKLFKKCNPIKRKNNP